LRPEGLVLILVGKLTLSGREAEHSLNVSIHWAWSQEEQHYWCISLTISEGRWSKIDVLETIFQISEME